MKVGVKLWSTNPPEQFGQAAKFADFIEVMPVDTESVGRLPNTWFSYTVHVPHERFGFSPLLDLEKSQQLLQQATSAARKLKAETIVMHTGFLKEAPGKPTTEKAIKAAAKLARTAGYGRLLIENSIPKDRFKDGSDRYFVCYDYEQIKSIMEASGAGFCLDLEHAAITAYQLGLDYNQFVSQLMKLKPEYFHLSGTRLATNGHHTSIFEGNIDREFVKKLLQKANKPVCLETPLDTEQRKKEVEFLKN
ncbi:TIM barrel protein [Candidatus Woesearchaeota archaeon]|nr:TIM barrel protein [Candidatus Woesearchaeota archaeon]